MKSDETMPETASKWVVMLDARARTALIAKLQEVAALMEEQAHAIRSGEDGPVQKWQAELDSLYKATALFDCMRVMKGKIGF